MVEEKEDAFVEPAVSADFRQFTGVDEFGAGLNHIGTLHKPPQATTLGVDEFGAGLNHIRTLHKPP